MYVFQLTAAILSVLPPAAAEEFTRRYLRWILAPRTNTKLMASDNLLSCTSSCRIPMAT